MKTASSTQKTKAQKQSYLFDLVFLTALYGIIWFKLDFNWLLGIIIHHVGETNTKDLLLYVLAWPITIVSGVLTTWILTQIFKKRQEPYIYSILCFLNFGFALFIFYPQKQTLSAWLPLVFFLFLQPFGYLIILKFKKIIPNHFRDFLFFGILILGMIWLFLQVPDIFLFPGHFYNYLILFGLLFVLFFYPKISSKFINHPSNAFADFLQKIEPYQNLVLYLLVFILGACLINADSAIDPTHYYFYMGPVTDLIRGKALLVNINSQYGIGVFYFLRLLFYFLPLNLDSLWFVLVSLTLVQFMIFYFISKKLLHSQWAALLTSGLFLLLTYLAPGGIGRVIFPGIGPLRFILIYLLLFLIVLRNEHPSWVKGLDWIEGFLAAYAFTWSLDVCVYIVPAYIMLLFYESFEFKNKIIFSPHNTIRRLFIFMIFVASNFIFIYLDTFRRTDQWPHWSYYFDYIFDYCNGIDPIFMQGRGYWWLAIGIIYISFWCIVKFFFFNEKKPPHFNVVVLLTFFGIFQFLYYIYRPQISYLGFVAMPSILLGVYWLLAAHRNASTSIPKAFQNTGYFLVILMIGMMLIQKIMPGVFLKLNGIPISPDVVLNSITNVFRNHPPDPWIEKANQLVHKFSGNKKSIVYFFGDSGLYFSMETDHTNVYPYDDITQAGSMFQKTNHRILSYDPKLKKGDFIYTTYPNDFEKQLFDQLQLQHKLKRVAYENQVAVYECTQ